MSKSMRGWPAVALLTTSSVCWPGASSASQTTVRCGGLGRVRVDGGPADAVDEDVGPAAVAGLLHDERDGPARDRRRGPGAAPGGGVHRALAEAGELSDLPGPGVGDARRGVLPEADGHVGDVAGARVARAVRAAHDEADAAVPDGPRAGGERVAACAGIQRLGEGLRSEDGVVVAAQGVVALLRHRLRADAGRVAGAPPEDLLEVEGGVVRVVRVVVVRVDLRALDVVGRDVEGDRGRRGVGRGAGGRRRRAGRDRGAGQQGEDEGSG